MEYSMTNLLYTLGFVVSTKFTVNLILILITVMNLYFETNLVEKYGKWATMEEDTIAIFVYILFIIGAWFILHYLVIILINIFLYIRVIFNFIFPTKLNEKYGKWAVITGCTDGIGLAYSKELAKRGLNIVLISRNLQKLQNVANHLEDTYKVETKIIQVDFSNDGRSAYEIIKSQQLDKLDIGILVNNVGVIYPNPMLTEKLEEQIIWDHIMCNVNAATIMIKILLPILKLNKKGAIINISSTAALNPLPYMNIYSATKAYLEYMSKSLMYECKGSGVTIQTLVPNFINTKMLEFNSIFSSCGLLVPKAETYVNHAIATLGVYSFTTGYLPHSIQYWILSFIPEWMYIPGAALLFKLLRNNK